MIRALTYKKYRQTNKGRRARRKAAQKYRKNHPDIIYCGHQISHRIECKKIIKPTECMSCGGNECVEAHHPDYTKPLEIIWICQKCHNDLHKNIA